MDAMSYRSLSTPAVIIDMDAVEENIAAMIAGAKKHKMTHRPHTKTHKSVFMAKKQLEMGACGITCAKLGEAEVMADSGIDDILLAFPMIGADKLKRLIALKKRIKRLIVIANSVEGATGLSEAAMAADEVFDLLIEVDGGMNRGGVAPGEAVVAFADRIRHLPGINICGILYYDALASGSKGQEEIIAAAEREGENVRKSAELLRQAGFKTEILSAGSSFSAKYPEYLTGVTELRPGTYIYNDRSQLAIGMVTEKQCALRVIATVVSRPDEHTAIIDAGSKTLSSDTLSRASGYGYVMEHPEVAIVKLNEEHGYMKSEGIMPFRIADLATIIPNHACVVSNLAEEAYAVRGGQVVATIAIEARGKNR